MTPTLTNADDYSPRCGQMPARGLCSVPVYEPRRRDLLSAVPSELRQ